MCVRGRWEGKGQRQRSQAGPEAGALSQGLLLWLLLSAGGVWTSRGPLRPLCRPINATLTAENEACPVCITFTTSICAGYCPSMVSCPGQVGTSPAVLSARVDHSGPGVQKTGGGSRGRSVACPPGQGLGNWSQSWACGSGSTEGPLET